jgi:MFS family permease
MSAGCLAAPPEAMPFATRLKERESSQPAADISALRKLASANLADAGSGRFQIMAAIVLGLANCSDAVELLAVSFILPRIDTTREDRAFISAGTFVGMLIGGFTAGVLADSFGRRNTLCYSLVINALFGALSAASPNASALATLRLLAGIGVGGSVPTIFTLLVELLAPKNRGFYVNIVAFCWVLGMVFTAGAAWLLLGLAGTSWRVFAIVCAVPALVGALLVRMLLPESPLWLARQGRGEESAKALQLIAKWNHRIIDTTGMNRNGSLALPVTATSPPQTAAIFAGACKDSESEHQAVLPVGSESPAMMRMPSPSASASRSATGSLAGCAAGSASAVNVLKNEPSAPTGTVLSCRRVVHLVFAPFLHAASSLRLLYFGPVWRSAVLLSVVWFTLSLAWYSIALW